MEVDKDGNFIGHGEYVVFDHVVQLGTPVILSLDETQRHYLERRYAKSNDKLRRDYLQSDPEKRLDASVKTRCQTYRKSLWED